MLKCVKNLHISITIYFIAYIWLDVPKDTVKQQFLPSVTPKSLTAEDSTLEWIAWMQIDITFSGRSPKLRSKTWGINRVKHPSKRFGKDYLQGRLHLIRLVVLQPWGTSTDKKKKTPAQKTCAIFVDLSYQHVLWASRIALNLSLSKWCLTPVGNGKKINQAAPKLNSLWQLYCSITDDKCLNVCIVTMQAFKQLDTALTFAGKKKKKKEETFQITRLQSNLLFGKWFLTKPLHLQWVELIPSPKH